MHACVRKSERNRDRDDRAGKGKRRRRDIGHPRERRTKKGTRRIAGRGLGDGENVYPSTENENCIVEHPYERAKSLALYLR